MTKREYRSCMIATALAELADLAVEHGIDSDPKLVDLMLMCLQESRNLLEAARIEATASVKLPRSLGRRWDVCAAELERDVRSVAEYAEALARQKSSGGPDNN